MKDLIVSLIVVLVDDQTAPSWFLNPISHSFGGPHTIERAAEEFRKGESKILQE